MTALNETVMPMLWLLGAAAFTYPLTEMLLRKPREVVSRLPRRDQTKGGKR